MSLVDWVSNTESRLREEGLDGVHESAYMLYTGLWRILGSRLPLGTNVYEYEWDVLVLLDGCRVDSLRAAASSRPALSGVDSRVSLGSTSREWLAKTFTPPYEDEIAETAYVTANPYTEEIFGPGGGDTNSPFNPANWDAVTASTFDGLVEVWRDHWDRDLGTVPPRVVTDHAIDVARTERPSRLVVHYMQPHQPFIGERARERGHLWRDDSCWQALRQDETATSAVREAFEENLAIVLEEVELLAENVDGRLAISADHGNAFGEWGIYGHPNGFLHSSVKRVPWVELAATDRETHEPELTVTSGETTDGVAVSTESRLEDLGYL